MPKTSRVGGGTVAGVTADAVLPTEYFRADGVIAPAAGLAGATFAGYVAPAVRFLIDGTNIALDASKGNSFTVTLAGNRTLSSPTNPVDGQVIRVRVIQDGTGSRTLSYGGAYDFGTTGSPTLTTTAAAVDILGFEYVASLSKWCYLGSALGF